MQNNNSTSQTRGRPRNFEHETALDAATHVFWTHGFQGASMSALTEAMGISKPSLYAAFGDKESLYMKALERYLQNHFAIMVEAMNEEPNAIKAIENFLLASAAMLTNPTLPGGCFVVNGSADCGGALTPTAVEQALINSLNNLETVLRLRIERAQQEGQLTQTANAKKIAIFLKATFSGMGVLAKSGTSNEELTLIIKTAMNVVTAQSVLAI